MKPQSLMKEERVVQPPREIKPRSKTKPQLQKKTPQVKPRQKVNMPETENGRDRRKWKQPPTKKFTNCLPMVGFFHH
jgi:hypothetical protein